MKKAQKSIYTVEILDLVYCFKEIWNEIKKYY